MNSLAIIILTIAAGAIVVPYFYKLGAKTGKNMFK